MSIMDGIRLRQALRVLKQDALPPEHHPEMLYIGCVDARLDPIADIGIEKGKALIFRNIGALVPPCKEGVPAEKIADTDATSDVSMGAVLEFFLNHNKLKPDPAEPNKKKHIVISGHTDCGGLKACRDGCGDHDTYLPRYLSAIYDKVKSLVSGNTSDAAKLKELEKQSVRQSYENLLKYPVVEAAIARGEVEVHGWILDTARQHISEMDPDTKEFTPMTTKTAQTAHRAR